MYDISIIPAKFQVFMQLNPMYWFLDFARKIILFNECPSLLSFTCCLLFGVGFLLLGTFVFKKNQDKFIYYV